MKYIKTSYKIKFDYIRESNGVDTIQNTKNVIFQDNNPADKKIRTEELKLKLGKEFISITSDD